MMDRLRALAKEAAKNYHCNALMQGGHNVGHVDDGTVTMGFSECPHPDCVLVRDAALPPAEGTEGASELAEARKTIQRLNRRCQLAEAAVEQRVETFEQRSRKALRHFYFEFGRRSALDRHGRGIPSVRGWLDLNLRCRELEAEVERLRAGLAPAAPQWQPIETAPKHAKMIIVSARATSGEPLQTMFAYWNPEREWWYRLYAHAATRIYPTHWMPLPSPPGSAPAAVRAPLEGVGNDH